MGRLSLAFIAAAVMLIMQLLLAAYPLLSQLTPKSQSLALQPLTQGLASVKLIGILLGYLLLAFAAHAAPMLLTTKIFDDLARRGPARTRQLLTQRGMFILALAGMAMLMVIANTLVFPLSSAFPGSDLLFEQAASPALVYGLPAAYALAALYWLIYVADKRVQLTAACLLFLMLVAWKWPTGNSDHSNTPYGRPDLIVIGVDSLRPDHLTSFGLVDRSLAPTIDHLISESVQFDRAYTTQARTFVAYMSILTGQYPIHHGARENLYPATLIDESASIAHQLRALGYTTMLAMDESRFANFDENFGFDYLLTPPPGAADFLVGSLLDTVGTNFLQFLPYSYVVLPHIAGNRAAHTVYRSDVHNRRIAHAIEDASPSRPLLLVSHFCIAHAPFVQSKRLPPLSGPLRDSPSRYRAALRVADSQVKGLLNELRRNGRLNNAVVVLLSDHGEGFGLAKDAWHVAHHGSAISQRMSFYGHGTPALDEAQSRVVLAMQRFREGKPQWTPKTISTATSLVDVAPTLLSLARVHATGKFDGHVLLDRTGSFVGPVRRPVYLESGLSGASLRTNNVEAGKVVNEFSYLYTLTDDLRYELTRSELEEQLQAKQRAVVLGRYGLSSWPRRGKNDEDCWLEVDLTTKRATCYPRTTGVPTVTRRTALLCAHFREDKRFYQNWCQSAQHAAGEVGTSTVSR